MQVSYNEKLRGKPFREVQVITDDGVCFAFTFQLRFDNTDAALVCIEAFRIHHTEIPVRFTPEELAEAQNTATLDVYRLLKVTKG